MMGGSHGIWQVLFSRQQRFMCFFRQSAPQEAVLEDSREEIIDGPKPSRKQALPSMEATSNGGAACPCPLRMLVMIIGCVWGPGWTTEAFTLGSQISRRVSEPPSEDWVVSSCSGLGLCSCVGAGRFLTL